MAQLPLNPVPIDNDEYYEFSNGLLVIDIVESDFTDTMKRYLTAIMFQVYTKITETIDNEDVDTYIPIKDVSIMWNTNVDEAITLDNIPDGSYATIKPIVDKSVLELKDRNGNLLYPDAKDIVSFPIKISIV